jgi:hypothetical protein
VESSCKCGNESSDSIKCCSRVAIQHVVTRVVLSFRERERNSSSSNFSALILYLHYFYVHTCVHTYTHAHTYLNRCIRTYIRLHTCTCIYTLMYIQGLQEHESNMSFVSSDERNFMNPSHQSFCPYQYVWPYRC